MSRDDFGAVIMLVAIAGIGGVVGYALGGIAGDKQAELRMQEEARKRGFAEYTLVNGGPETKFQWKEAK